MKHLHFLLLVFVGCLFVLPACNSKKADPATEPNTMTTGDSVPMDPAIAATPSETNALHHFICPNNCKGSGGTQAGKCPVCGSEYVHNTAFHKGATVPEPAMKIDPVTNAAVPTSTEAQNASGVYHFTCPKGHEGGAGVAGNCPKCGTPLEHNQAFHSK